MGRDNQSEDELLDMWGASDPAPPQPSADARKAADAQAQEQEEESKILRENRKLFAQQMALMEEFSAKMELVFQIKINTSFFDKPFETRKTIMVEQGDKEGDEKAKKVKKTIITNENDSVPGIFLTKALSAVEVRNDFTRAANRDDDNAPAQIIARYGHLAVTCARLPSEDDEAGFVMSADGLQLHENILSNEIVATRHAIMEASYAAALMVKQAKAMGIELVNFGDTTDPIHRACLMMACKSQGIAVDEAEGTLAEANALLPYLGAFDEIKSSTLLEVTSCMEAAMTNPYAQQNLSIQPQAA